MRLATLSALAILAASPLTLLAQSGSANQYLNGQYAFLLKGVYAKTSAGASNEIVIAGSITADGQGHITSGIADFNSDKLTMTGMRISGSYTINADGTGTIGLLTPLGANTYTISVANNPVQTINDATFTSYSNPVGSGMLMRQDTAAFTASTTAPTTQDYLLSLSGETSCEGTCLTSGTGAQFVSTQGAGFVQLSAPNAASAGTVSIPVVVTGGTSYTTSQISGTLSAPDMFGRRLLTIPTNSPSNSGATSTQVTQLAFYQTAYNEFFVITLDPHSSTILESGVAMAAY